MIKARKRKVGKYFEIDPTAEIECEELEVGDCVTILEKVKIRGRKIKIGNYVRFCPYSEIGGGGGVPNSHSDVTIGDNVLICAHALINNAREVEIGDDVGVGQYVHIWTHGGWMNVLNGYPCTFASVKIGSHVWVPEKTSILAGVKIGDHVVIGNNSLVNKDIPSGCFAAGSPCKVIKENVYPKPLNEKEIDLLLERLVEEWKEEISYWFVEKNLDTEYLGKGKVRYQTNVFDTRKMKVSGDLDEFGEDFRDYLRRNGIKFFTGKPFVSLKKVI